MYNTMKCCEIFFNFYGFWESLNFWNYLENFWTKKGTTTKKNSVRFIWKFWCKFKVLKNICEFFHKFWGPLNFRIFLISRICFKQNVSLLKKFSIQTLSFFLSSFKFSQKSIHQKFNPDKSQILVQFTEIHPLALLFSHKSVIFDVSPIMPSFPL